MIKRLYLWLIATIITNICNAQHFQNINLNNGLSQPSVITISQDLLGRMWFGTREGINIYDGMKIKSYKGHIDNGNNQKLWIGNSISSIINGENKHSDKVFFISDYSLYMFNIKTDIFSKIEIGNGITAISWYNDNLLYAQKNKIFSYDINTQKKTIYKVIHENTIVNYILINNDNVYLATTDGVIKSSINAIGVENSLLKGEDIYRIFQDSEKNLWIGTRMKGLYKMSGSTIEKVPVCTKGTEGIIDPQIRDFAEDNNGNIWFGTFMGLQMYNTSTHKYTTTNIPKYAGGLNHPSIFALYKDKQGTIWTGSYYGGVNYFNPTRSSIEHYDYQIKDKSAIYYSYIAEMAMDKRKNLWISTDGGGIGCLNRNWEIIKQFTSKNKNETLRHTLPHNNIKSLCYDHAQDMIYIGTHLGGLSRYDIKNDRFYNYLTDYKSTGDAPCEIIHHLESWNGNIYVSAKNGVFRLDPVSNKFTKLTDFIGYCQIFDIDKYGNFYSITSQKLIITQIDNPLKREVINLGTEGNISHICAEGDKVYISTLGCGLIVYNPSSGKLDRYTTDNSNIPSNYCYSSKLTSNNKLILTGDNGISMFYTDKNEFLSIKHNYLKAPIIYGCGICISDDGDIFIGDTKGITRIAESYFTTITNNAEPVYFSDLYVNNNKITPSTSNSILKETLAFTDKINLNHNDNNVTIEFASSDYTNEHVQQVFEYKLEGMDKSWNLTTIPAARYTNLYPGKYKLYVKESGNQNANPAMLEIVISTPWYYTWWAWLGYIISALIVLEVIMRYRNEKKKLSLSLEKERFEKMNIEKLNHEKLVFFTNVSHEFRTPLSLIISHTDYLMQMSSLPPVVYNRIMKLKKNAMYMNNLVSELLDFRKFTQNRYTLKIREGNISKFMKEIFFTFSDYANEKNIEYKYHSEPENITGWFDAKQMEKVMLNILSNAFKYTHKGSINVNVSTSNNKVYISVKDTGKGISQNDSVRIFDRFYRTEENKNDASNTGTGIGLALTKSIVEKHHGEISVESNLGEGSTFTISIPLDCQEYVNDEHIEIIEPCKDENAYNIQNIGTNEKCEINICCPSDNKLLEDNKEQKKYNLLIVEDNPELIQVLGELFSPFYNVIKATNGKEGLEKAYKHKPDLIISDIMMPEMSGTEMCIQIKNNMDLCHIPVILITALNSTEQNIEGLNRGADDYISKPFNSNLLLARANNLVRNRLLVHHQISRNPIAEIDLTSINPIDQNILKKASETIEAHIDDTEFDISQLCKEIGLGRSALYAKFKSLTGMTPNSYILNYRLKYAASMLKKYPDMPVAEIGDKCGFGSPVYFGRCFKNQYGMTPQSYRKSDEK